MIEDGEHPFHFFFWIVLLNFRGKHMQINQFTFFVFLLKRVTSAVDIFMNLVHLVRNLFAIHIYIINS